jgi:hypothetical protein
MHCPTSNNAVGELLRISILIEASPIIISVGATLNTSGLIHKESQAPVTLEADISRSWSGKACNNTINYVNAAVLSMNHPCNQELYQIGNITQNTDANHIGPAASNTPEGSTGCNTASVAAPIPMAPTVLLYAS